MTDEHGSTSPAHEGRAPGTPQRRKRSRRRSQKRRRPQFVRTIPPISYPDLPVSERREDIKKAIENNQVVIIAGETGSGKTTQIPKMCLELGRGRTQVIGHTQPRRIAARSVAERIAEELEEDSPGGSSLVGYKIRFDDTISKETAVKLMTDGVLLNEIQRDRLLRDYDTIIVDEAHERSLNIDFLLGYLKQLLPKRPDLKVIITSATIDPESFAQHFCDAHGSPAPIIEVSGRTYPVEIRYRPLVTQRENPKIGEVVEVETDPLDGLVAACKELMRAGDGDILCFFSGEREIRDAAEALEGEFAGSGGAHKVDVLPLFGRLSNAEQHRVFRTGPRRRIVLATNIAETSLTVPGIHYVVDTGYARISRYSHRTKVQRLPVEPISQASAKQRSGRSGRIADGIAIRLYSEEDFEARPEFTDPEILRTHLSSVILSMAALGLGDIQKFPFLQAPDSKSIRDGVALLQELGALASEKEATLTPIGRDMARIPTDPRLARMLVAGHANNLIEPIAVIVSALSIQDVRERPLEKQQQADEMHARFKANSDFVSLLKLWNYLQQQRQELSANKFRKLCQREFIHYVRVREWMDLVRQMLSVVQDLSWKIPNIRHVRELVFEPESINEDLVHKSVLSGLLTHVGMREGNSKQFTGTRGSHFVVHPSSHVSKKPPQWLMAAELVETSQVFARTVGPIDPSWIEAIAPHMVKYNYSEPVWSSSRGAAMVHEKVLLLGLPIDADRMVNASKVDRPLARELFIRHALVEGDWKTRHHFFAHNQKLLAEATELEDKARRRDIVVDDQVLFDFYDARLPEKIVSSRHFDSWWKKARHKDPHQLDFTLEALIDSQEAAQAADDFPDIWQQGSLEFELSYVFLPGDPDDGITMRVPLPLLANVSEPETRWLVAGMREELAVALIRSLPKPLRTSVVPASNFASAALQKMVPFDGDFDFALAEALRGLGGQGISAQDFDWSRVPGHLRMQFAAIDRRGKVIEKSRDLQYLQNKLSGQVTSAIAQAAARSNLASPSDAAQHSPAARKSSQDNRGNNGNKVNNGTARAGRGKTVGTSTGVLATAEAWTADGIGVLPETVETIVDGQTLHTYPAIVASTSTGKSAKSGVTLKAFPTRQAADAQQFTTVLNMMIDACTVSPNQMIKGLPLRQRVAMEQIPGGVDGLVNDVVALACRDMLMKLGPIIRDPERCEEVVAEARSQGPGRVRQYVVALAPAVLAVADMTAELQGWSGAAIDDMQGQLDFFLGKHAIARNGIEHMRHVPRYVEAMRARLELMKLDPDKEEDLDDEVQEAFELLEKTKKRLPTARAASPQIKEVRWMIEELRVSLFAQNLGTAHSVSLQRIRKKLEKIR
ncbi:ATP-dependent RNA helicase HrpA [Corynebacterium macclintockiae]|uniref:ATP-dependent RNA helicase HrpA n=1 Tax=Corynebacterium macclintockiae TaxID=2913501 RepID=UPI003EBE24DA